MYEDDEFMKTIPPFLRRPAEPVPVESVSVEPASVEPVSVESVSVESGPAESVSDKLAIPKSVPIGTSKPLADKPGGLPWLMRRKPAQASGQLSSQTPTTPKLPARRAANLARALAVTESPQPPQTTKPQYSGDFFAQRRAEIEAAFSADSVQSSPVEEIPVEDIPVENNPVHQIQGDEGGGNEDAAFQVTLPRNVIRQIRVLAAEEGTTHRAIVLRSLRHAGLAVPEGADVDRRVLAAKRRQRA